MNDNHRFSAEFLRDYAATHFRRAGVPAEEAAYLAESIVLADMRGIASHGLMRLRTYVTRLRRGVVRSGARPRIVRESPAFVALDGENGNGMWIARQAMELCVSRARLSGACFATICNGNHFGIAARYTAHAVGSGMIGVAMANSIATTVPTGGRRPLLGTNPLSIAVPLGSRAPLVLDMATTKVARGNIVSAAKEGRKAIPADWAVDAEGNPTTDPLRALDGAMLSFGGAKGYGLALVVEILSATLSGALPSTQTRSFFNDFENPQGIGFFLGAWNIASVMPLATFEERVGALIDEIKACPPAPGHAEVFYPGEIEHRREQESLRDGVPLSPAIVEDLRRLGEEFSVPFPGGHLAGTAGHTASGR